VNKSVEKGGKGFNSATWGNILVVDFLEHYNHEGKLVGINIRVTSSLSSGRNVLFEKIQLKDGANWKNRQKAIQRSQRNASGRITNSKKASCNYIALIQ
jgi:hypothetical protein